MVDRRHQSTELALAGEYFASEVPYVADVDITCIDTGIVEGSGHSGFDEREELTARGLLREVGLPSAQNVNRLTHNRSPVSQGVLIGLSAESARWSRDLACRM